MHSSPDLLQQLVADRRLALQAEAEAHRAAGSVGARTRVARFLRRTADRLDLATAAPCQVCRALPERS